MLICGLSQIKDLLMYTKSINKLLVSWQKMIGGRDTLAPCIARGESLRVHGALHLGTDPVHEFWDEGFGAQVGVDLDSWC